MMAAYGIPEADIALARRLEADLAQALR